MGCVLLELLLLLQSIYEHIMTVVKAIIAMYEMFVCICGLLVLVDEICVLL